MNRDMGVKRMGHIAFFGRGNMSYIAMAKNRAERWLADRTLWMPRMSILHRVPSSVWSLPILAFLCVPCLAAEAVTLGKATVIVDNAPIKDRGTVRATAKKGTVLDVIQVSGEWYLVSPAKGWVYRSHVTYEPIALSGADVLRKRAVGGDTDAMYLLGGTYELGCGVAKDEREAASWYRKAADAGNAAAMYALSIMYDQGRGVAKDELEAVRWCRKAAESGDTAAMCSLGARYANGSGAAKDDREAVSWFRKAAEAGNPEGMSNLGAMYEYGSGVAKDEREAVGWYRKAAEGGHASAMSNLGRKYEDGGGVPKDEREAVRWYRKAIEAGHVNAMCLLGGMYAHGRGVPQDDIEAYAWFSAAAALGQQHAPVLRDLVARRLTAQSTLTAQERSRVLFEQISRQVRK